MSYPPIVQVDENGRVVGPIEYDDAHPKDEKIDGVRHATVNGLIFDSPKYDRVLKAMRGGQASYAGKWDSSFGGHLDWIVAENRPESFDEAAEREAREELFYGQERMPSDLRLTQIDKFWKTTRPNNPEFVGLYKGVCSGPFSVNLKEVRQVEFEEVGELIKDMKDNPQRYTKSFGVCVQRFLDIMARRDHYK